MNILFLTVSRITEISKKGLYTDLSRKFQAEGHRLFIATPNERRFRRETGPIQDCGITILRIRTLNFQKTNTFEKGLCLLLIRYFYQRAIKKHLSHISFDLVIYPTPPITLTKVVRNIKQRDGAKTYLLLKDIFPQNAVDLGMIKEGGLLHRNFKKKENRLYAISDHIGCMSPANRDYLIKMNPHIDPDKVEVNPNSIEPVKSLISPDQIRSIRRKYRIPEDAIVFIYGGNLGKPQGIEFLLEVLSSQSENKNAFFVVAGMGTEYARVKSWFNIHQPLNVIITGPLPRSEYDLLLQTCDVGMIFLDRRFTIPNFPSRLLSYLETRLPVISATDSSTDLGSILENNGFGLSSESGDLQKFNDHLAQFTENSSLRKEMGKKGYHYLLDNYTVSHSYQMIMNHLLNYKKQ